MIIIKDEKGRLYVDRWCANNVRKVKDCSCCLHFEACKKAGHSLSPTAIEHAGLSKTNKSTFESDLTIALSKYLED